MESLLERFNLVGENSHRAIDDVGATVSLVRLCDEKSAGKVAEQQAFLAHPRVIPYVRKFRSAYQELFVSAYNGRYAQAADGEKALVRTMKQAYDYFLEMGVIDAIDRLDYVLRYLAMDMLTDDHVSNALIESSWLTI